MAPRAYWKGSLKLSLVTCPVAVYPATTSAEKTRFHMINKETGNRLKQQMVDAETGDVVERDEKARGYELRKGKYVEIEPEELDAVQIESNHTIDIDSFVPRDEIDKRYLNHPYYIAPDGKAAIEAFAVIRDAMKDQDRVALARIVLTNREHVMAIEPLGKGLLGTTLRYPYELRDEEDYFENIKSPKITKDMIELAGHILHSKAAHFDPSKFKDEYEDALKALVRRKASGKKIDLPEPEERPSNVINLMDALRQSLKGRAAAKRAQPAARRQSSPSPCAQEGASLIRARTEGELSLTRLIRHSGMVRRTRPGISRFLRCAIAHRSSMLRIAPERHLVSVRARAADSRCRFRSGRIADAPDRLRSSGGAGAHRRADIARPSVRPTIPSAGNGASAPCRRAAPAPASRSYSFGDSLTSRSPTLTMRRTRSTERSPVRNTGRSPCTAN